ncbi:sensor histidine kinase [Sciscionella marina]|uniref:sensor histidine kinase n=1 Tax=Sciscionella marina TaxID=508770 RepID=UPI001F09813B|nr:histidine kinase [Sciscionella marina]
MSVPRLPPLRRFAPVLFPAFGALMSITQIVAEVSAGTPRGELLADLGVLVLACVLLAGLPRWPVPVVLTLIVLTAFAFTATIPAAIATLEVASRQRPRVSCLVGVAGILAQAIFGLWRPMPGLSYGWWLVIVVFAFIALVGVGMLIRTRRALIDSLAERANRAEAEQGRRVAEARIAERAALAREMHDVLAHRLSLVATYAGALEYRADAEPAKLVSAAGVVREGVYQALGELREVIGVLREDTDASDRPRPGLPELRELVAEARAAGTPVRFDYRIQDGETLPPATGHTGYRVVQEGLTNARKHAAGQEVQVRVEGEPGTGVRIEVSNPVPGTDSSDGRGTGLIGLTERARLTGGKLDHQLTGSGEFRLDAWLPWGGES